VARVLATCDLETRTSTWWWHACWQHVIKRQGLPHREACVFYMIEIFGRSVYTYAAVGDACTSGMRFICPFGGAVFGRHRGCWNVCLSVRGWGFLGPGDLGGFWTFNFLFFSPEADRFRKPLKAVGFADIQIFCSFPKWPIDFKSLSKRLGSNRYLRK
jgi:hypothetical protein